MNPLPASRYQRTLFLLFLVFFLASCVNPPYLQFMLLQHSATLLAVALLAWLSSKIEITRLSYTLIIVFLCLHTLGARYLYTYTPYDTWSETLLGINITETFAFERNHYDRLVHFTYGLLLVIPILEYERRYLKLTTLVAAILAVECILATSAAYELLEWLVALIFAPDWAESFLGLQGDPFDAQKDMALATSGAILAVGVYLLSTRSGQK